MYVTFLLLYIYTRDILINYHVLHTLLLTYFLIEIVSLTHNFKIEIICLTHNFNSKKYG